MYVAGRPPFCKKAFPPFVHHAGLFEREQAEVSSISLCNWGGNVMEVKF